MHQKRKLNINHLAQRLFFLLNLYYTTFSELSYNTGLQYTVFFLMSGCFFNHSILTEKNKQHYFRSRNNFSSSIHLLRSENVEFFYG